MVKPLWWLYILIPVLLLGAGFGSAYLTNSGNDNEWYQNMPKAPWTPPGWVFSVVWSILYVLIGVVLARTIVDKSYQTSQDQARLSLLSLVIVGILLWPFVYFLGQSQFLGIALIVAIVLLSIVYTVMSGVNKKFVEMGCMIPLVLWGGFATSLAIYPLCPPLLK